MKNVVVLCVTGSIAAYRAGDLARELMRNNCEVRVCLTRSAAEFVTAALFEGLTGQPCLTNVFDEPLRGKMAHIDWARAAKCIIVCPATANAIATLSQGKADDMFSSLVLASEAPLIICPAMNPQMYANEATQSNLKTLELRGATIIEPAEGEVACGENGQGKLASTASIVAIVLATLDSSATLSGKKIVVTAGPTYEAIDPVRFIGNRSSGKMGVAIANAAAKMGADVTLILGPSKQISNQKVKTVRVETAEQMLTECLIACKQADYLIGAAAVADYKPENVATEKIKRKEQTFDLHLVRNPDILNLAKEKHPSLNVIGFAAETHDIAIHAKEKIQSKRLFAIAANDVSSKEIGFDSDENEIIIYFENGHESKIERAPKSVVARKLLEAILAHS